MSASLAECARSNGKMDKPLKVRVLHLAPVTQYKSKAGDDRQSLTAAISDGTTVTKLVVLETSMFRRIVVDNSITIRNYIIRGDGNILINNQSRVFLTADLAVSQDLVKEGKDLIDPPIAEFVSISEGLKSPPKRCISLKGQVVQEDREREVSVRNTPTKVKEIWLSDSTTQKAKVTLWRDQCNSAMRPGDFVEITDVVTSSYKNDMSFSLTTRSTLKVVEAPLTENLETIEGIFVDGDVVELMTTNDNILTMSKDTLAAAIPLACNIERYICDNVPIDFIVICKGGLVEKLTLKQNQSEVATSSAKVTTPEQTVISAPASDEDL